MLATTLKIKENTSGRSYRAVSCQASNSSYIIVYYPSGLKNFSYSLLILYQIHLARILQYASAMAMAPLPCNSQLHIYYPSTSMIILVNDMTCIDKLGVFHANQISTRVSQK